MSTKKSDADVEGGPRSSTDNKAPNRPPDYFNYHPPISLILLEFLVLLFLGLVCFLPPSGSGGLTSIVKSDSEYIGVLKTCSDTTCQAYMAASSTSSASSSTSSDSTKRSSLSPRDSSLSSSIDISNLFLTTGLAALAAFWLMLYLFLLSSYRYLTSPPPSEDDEDHKPRRFWDIRDGLKRYAYRVCRIYVVVQFILVLGVACAASWSFNQGREAGGSLGMGILLLHASWPLLFCCAFIELSRGRWRKRIDLGWCGCTCLALFGRSKRRAERKWGTEGKSASTSREQNASGSRSRSRSRGRDRAARRNR